MGRHSRSSHYRTGNNVPSLTREIVFILLILVFFIILLTSCSEQITDPRRPDLARQAQKEQQTRLQYY